MKIKTLVCLSVVAAALSACGGGDINVDANNNSSVDNSIGDGATVITGGDNSDDFDCASFVDEDGNTQTGQVDGDDCFYSESFVDFDNPLSTSITLPNIGDGAHIFAGSIYVGENYATIADATTAGIERGGDGPTLTIRAGVTVAFQNAEDLIAVNRGSRIEAQGTSTAPITFTSEADYRGNVSPEEVQSWGGMVINGFGFANGCTYEAGWDGVSTTGLVIAAGGSCSRAIEGVEGDRESFYGGTVPNDNSGTLSYVVVKHAGRDIVEGNELNGITFGAVGSETTLNNIQIYSNFDDGIEFFGGGADLTNYVAMYVRDDSIDIDEGYYGTITNALVIQGGAVDEATKTGAHCVESDGSSSSRKDFNIENDYVSKATINNLTCIISAKGPGVAGNSDPGAGINAEEAHNLTINRSIVTTAYTSDATVDGNGDAIDAGSLDFTNYCFQLEDSEDLVNAAIGNVVINQSIFACADISANKARNSDITTAAIGTQIENDDSDVILEVTAGNAVNAGVSGQAFLEAQDNVVATGVADDGTTPPNAGNLVILNGFYSEPLATMVVDGAAVTFDTTPSHVGAVLESSDWTEGWTYGLHEDNRGQALWFE